MNSISYDKFLVNFSKYRYLYLLVFSIVLLFLVIIYAKMIFNIRHNIAELIALQRRIKSAFDPKGLLNPGKIFLN